MQLPQLIDALSDPAAYPVPLDAVEVRHTHISVVFLVGSFVYKIKKPVNLGFLDFSTLEKRRHFCEQEVQLNKRLAPDVYRGVVPVAQSGAGVKVEGAGEVVEWAVKMRRLPDEATLENRLERGAVDAPTIESLGAKIADFHRRAEGGARIAEFGRFDVVARNARENSEQSTGQIGTAISREVFDRLRTVTEAALERNRPLVESRAARGVPRDTHGDLRLGHVYLFPRRQPPRDVVVVDCIEFNERFRFADPVADIAFLLMGLKFHDRGDLAAALAEAYFQASGDDEGRALLPLYISYRAAVRGKVEGLKSTRAEVPRPERDAAARKARGYWLLALGELERPERRPCLVLVGGLPGSGKSTLAADLAAQAGFRAIRSDVVRKELAGPGAAGQKAHGFEQGIYTPEWTERTYTECLRRAEQLLFEGQRVVVDASFGSEDKRREFLDAATRWGVPRVFLVCKSEAALIRQRLANRRGDASEADWSIYLQAAQRWQHPSQAIQSVLHAIATDGNRQQALDEALSALRDCGLWS